MSTDQALAAALAAAEAAALSKESILPAAFSVVPHTSEEEAGADEANARANKKVKLLDGSSRDVFDSLSSDAVPNVIPQQADVEMKVESHLPPTTVPASMSIPPNTSADHSQLNGNTSDKPFPPVPITSPVVPSVLEGSSTVDSAILNATFPSLAPLSEGMITDPALIRIYVAYHDPQGFQVRLRENWKTLKQLSSAYQQTEACMKKRSEHANEKSSAKPASSRAAQTKRPTSSSTLSNANRTYDSAPRLRRSGGSGPKPNSSSSSGAKPGRGQRIFSANPPASRRTVAHVSDPLLIARPSSCPPVLQRDALLLPPTFSALPKWLQKLSAPRWDGTPRRKNSSTSACPHISYKSSSTKAESAEKTSADVPSLTVQTSQSIPISAASDNHEPHFVAPVTPSKPHLPTKPSSDAPYSLPPLPRNLSLISPRTFVSTVVTATPLDSSIVSSAASIAAALFAAANSDAKTTAAAPSTTISIPSEPVVRPRRAGLPQFGDSVLVQSINSTASSSVHCVENAGTVVAATLPQIALVRQSSSVKKEPVDVAKTEVTTASMADTPSAQTDASSAAVVPTVAEMVADALQDWKSISMNFVDSFLNPPSFSQLHDSSRQPRPILAAALARFAPCNDEALIKREEKDPIHLLNVATGIVREGGIIKLEPLSPQFKPASLSVSLSQIATSTSLENATSNVLLSPSHHSMSNHGTPSLVSPHISRMSSWLQTHPTKGHSTPLDPNADVPMSPRMLTLTNDSTLTTTATTSATTVTSDPHGGNASPATVSGHNTASRVGPEFQCEIPALLTAEQREWERRAYMHAHAAVHGFPKHLPPAPAAPAAPVTPKEYLPIPLLAPPSHCISSFPASASFALASASSELRESVTGSRKIARRKAAAAAALEEAKRKGFDNLSRSAKLATLSFPLPERAPNWLQPSDIYPLTWDDYRERENTAMGFTSSNGFPGSGPASEREQRKRARDEMPIRPSARSGVNSSRSNSLLRQKFLSTHPSFASYASLFPGDSALARMHFDDDTLSPYYASAPFVRPSSPTQHVRRQRSISPVHVLSSTVELVVVAADGTSSVVPASPTKFDKKRVTSLSRFPSSLLETTKFNKRVARLASGEKEAEEVYYDDEAEMRQLEDGRRKKDAIVAARQMINTKTSASSPHKKPRSSMGVRFEDEEAAPQQPPAQQQSEPTSPSFHRNARSIKPAPRHAVRPSPAAAITTGAPGASPSIPPTRFKKWKTVNGARIVWWVDHLGRVVEGNPPPDSSSSDSDSDNDSPNINSSFPAAAKWHNDEPHYRSDDDESMSDGESVPRSALSESDESSDDGDGYGSSRSSSPVQRIIINRSQLPTNFVLPRSQHRHWRSAAISRSDQWARSPLEDPNAKPKNMSLANLAPPARIQAAKTGVAKMLDGIPLLFEEAGDLDAFMISRAVEWDEDEEMVTHSLLYST